MEVAADDLLLAADKSHNEDESEAEEVVNSDPGDIADVIDDDREPENVPYIQYSSDQTPLSAVQHHLNESSISLA